MQKNFGRLVICIASSVILGCGGGGYSELAEQAEQEAVRADPAGSASAIRSPTADEPTADSSVDSAGETDNATTRPVQPATPAAEPVATTHAPQQSERAASPLTGPVPTARRGVVSGVLGARNRNTAMSNGKQIGVGMMQYESASGRYPAQATLSSEGKPLLSWRVELMKTLDRNLYDAFNHDVAWDHPDNKPLIEKMPSIFDTGYPLTDGHTAFMVVTGKETMFPQGAKGGMKLAQCSDGTVKTILCVVADPELAVPWTKPQDLEFNRDNPSAGLVGPDETIIGIFCDGSVRRMSGLDAATVKAILTPRGGEVVGSLE